jgi:hypothetical protein
MKTKVQLIKEVNGTPFRCELCEFGGKNVKFADMRLVYEENGEMVDHFYHSNCIGIELANIITANEERDKHSDEMELKEFIAATDHNLLRTNIKKG